MARPARKKAKSVSRKAKATRAKPARKANSRKPTRQKVKLLIDAAKETYWSMPFANGDATITLPVKVSALEEAKKGLPFICWIANAIMAHSTEHPGEYPHQVHYAYVTKSVVILVDQVKGVPVHCVKYRHNLGHYMDKFDDPLLTKSEFLKMIPGDALTLNLKPGRPSRSGESKVGGNGSGGKRTKTVLRGAKRRAENAGLLPLSV